jgi:hypothetical protein
MDPCIQHARGVDLVPENIGLVELDRFQRTHGRGDEDCVFDLHHLLHDPDLGFSVGERSIDAELV